jgi:hypothetical protein
MTYVQQNKRNLVAAAAAAAGVPVPPLTVVPAPAPARRRARLQRPRRMTRRTLALAALVAAIPVSVTATVVVHHATKASHKPLRFLTTGVDGTTIDMPVLGALPDADASTWSALTRPAGDAERDPDNMKALMTFQDDSSFGINASFARQLTFRDGHNVWLMPGNGFVCVAMQPIGATTMSAGCNTDDAARTGALTTGDGIRIFGVAPDGVSSITVTDADTGLRHDEPVVDNVYELAYKPANIRLTLPDGQPVSFDVVQ